MREISQELILEAAQGDIEAFEAIYKAYSGFVYNVALRVVERNEDAQEVTQDVFIAIYNKLKDFAFKSSLKTWIYRITVNLAINQAKKRSRTEDRLVVYDEMHDLGAPDSALEEKIDREHGEKVLSDLLGALNPEQRACLVLRSIEGLSYEEISGVLEVNINTVRTSEPGKS